MSINTFNINSDEFVVLTNKLQRIGRAEMPIAIRNTLNEMAFRMKGVKGQRGMIAQTAESDFDFSRNKTLFKTITGVNKAVGLNINNMQSEAGILNKSGLNKVAEGLADQQKGGSTEQKATPLTASRAGGNIGSKVRTVAHLRNLATVDMRNKKGKDWINAAIKAKKERQLIFLNGKNSPLIARVMSYERGAQGIRFKMKWLYRINQSGTVKLKQKRPFVNNAAIKVMNHLDSEFVNQMKKRLNKIR